MERIEVQYINEYRKKEDTDGLIFLALISLGFICAVGALCVFLLMIQ